MLYLTGIYALNIEDSTECCGDWHTSALNWDRFKLYDSDKSVFGDFGIECNKRIPNHSELYNVANTLRSVLDIMDLDIDGGSRWLKGLRNDFLCTDLYNTEFFEKVVSIRGRDNWSDINELMKREFMWGWDKFMEAFNDVL